MKALSLKTKMIDIKDLFSKKSFSLNETESKAVKRLLIIGIGTALYVISNPVFAMAMDYGGINKLGSELLDIIQNLGYWIFLISALSNLIKNSLKAGSNKVSEIITTVIGYILLYALLFFLPKIFKEVRTISQD